MSGIHYSDLWQGIAAADPDRPAIITGRETMTYARFAAEAGAVARHLREHGVGVGDAAALLLYNRTEYLTFFWACLAIGAAPVAINYRYPGRRSAGAPGGQPGEGAHRADLPGRHRAGGGGGHRTGRRARLGRRRRRTGPGRRGRLCRHRRRWRHTAVGGTTGGAPPAVHRRDHGDAEGSRVGHGHPPGSAPSVHVGRHRHRAAGGSGRRRADRHRPRHAARGDPAAAAHAARHGAVDVDGHPRPGRGPRAPRRGAPGPRRSAAAGARSPGDPARGRRRRGRPAVRRGRGSRRARPAPRGFDLQLGDAIQRRGEAAAARAGRHHDRRPAGLERGRPVRLRHHAFGRRPARTVHAHSRDRAAERGEHRDPARAGSARHPRLPRSAPAWLPR
ncbi:AMP-binding protein [Microbacterium lushaniae]|uniref:AMP-binding protein n=1 Tax=Microbacterium lushaniae TaxID=2614639 RepID=A0A5J6L7T8_9MICO|nr:AMP-binding protein [Microbacterium lushaniae]